MSQTDQDRPALLLVHGSWHGGWCWEPLDAVLRARGWETHLVDLPTVNAPNPERYGLADDARAIEDAITAIGKPVEIVAHSYGGLPAAEARSDLVRGIVFLAAFVVEEGRSLVSALGGGHPDWLVIGGAVHSAGTAAMPPKRLFYDDVDPSLAESCVARLRPQSNRAFSDTVQHPAWREVPSTYVVTEQDAVLPQFMQEGFARLAGSKIVHLPTSHSPFLSQPQQTADIVERAASPC